MLMKRTFQLLQNNHLALITAVCKRQIDFLLGKYKTWAYL